MATDALLHKREPTVIAVTTLTPNFFLYINTPPRFYYDGIIYQILPSLKKTILITYSATPPVYIEICFENCYFISKKTAISRLLHNIPYVVFRKCSFHDEIYIVEKTLEILIFK